MLICIITITPYKIICSIHLCLYSKNEEFKFVAIFEEGIAKKGTFILSLFQNFCKETSAKIGIKCNVP